MLFFQIDRESGKKVASNLEKIMSDYQQMKKENRPAGGSIESLLEKIIDHTIYNYSCWLYVVCVYDTLKYV